jgi:hypothetical protein
MTIEKYDDHPPVPALATEAPLPVTDVLRQLHAIEEIRAKVMQKDVHYGEIPGCPQPVLLQAGAEKLCLAFRLVTEDHVEDLSTAAEARYRVTCTVRSAVSGCVLGNAVAECSSGEEKYAWRRAASSAEFAATAPDRRRIKYGGKRDGSTWETEQVATLRADSANTVLAMACKRAEVRAVRKVLAVSDLFLSGDAADEVRRESAPRAAGQDDRGVARASHPNAGGPAGSTVITFGKHSGASLAQVYATDPGYITWLGDNAKAPEMKAAVRAFLAGGAAAADSDAVPPPPGDDDIPPTDPFADQ